MTSKNVAVYLRQSQDRDGGQLGVDRQREDVQRYIAARGWTIGAEFIDNDVSATSRKPRPAFLEMMRRVDAGEFDIIMSRHMDRLLRRLAELEDVLERCQATGTAIVTAADGIDTSTDGGRTTARILASVAQGEVERKSARQKSAVAQAARQGRWVGGRRPFGFEADGITVRPDEAELIVLGYKAILAGESIGAVGRSWSLSCPTPQGCSPWGRSSVKDVLTNPRYCGLRRHRTQEQRAVIRQNPEAGIAGKAEWPAIVDEATWRAAVRVLCDPSRTRKALSSKGLLTSIAECAVCGTTVHRGARSHGKGAYRCKTGRHVARLSQPVDDYVEKLVIERLRQPDAAELWIAERPDAADLMTEADTLRRRLDDLALDYADGVMTREQFRVANERVTTRLAALNGQIAAAGKASPLAIVAEADVAKAYTALPLARRRALIDALMVVKLHPVGQGRGTFRPDTVEIIWRTPA